MVFESLVVDVLNRFLGDYVENLDHSQLKIGIWGGDVVLQNLVLKQNALEELDIPMRIVYGHLGRLVLKIPWKNLYGASVEASVENLFLIVTPSSEVKYDPAKEEAQALAAKQAELQRVEEAKKQEASKDQPQVDDSFVEKLVAQIIKNVQIHIADIHVRYEDSTTIPTVPFSCGFTLHKLSVHSTDANWIKAVVAESVTKVYKILDLEGLAVYFNPVTKLYSKQEKTDLIPLLKKEIATKDSQPAHYQYMLGPINSTARLILNPKPEQDEPAFSIPKLRLTLHMSQLMVSITKAQYQNITRLADSVDMMTRAAPYRKYRPDVPYRGHYKEWWQFAYTCILEENVRRRRRNWDWNHISNHRQLCKEYGKAYQCKLTSKVTPKVKDILETGEKILDVFNLVIIRQQIEFEVARLGRLQAEATKNRGWFGGWFGSRTSEDDKMESSTDILKQFQNAMTPEEKKKLFRAIDYQENTAPLHLPDDFVAVKASFHLDMLMVTVNDGNTQVAKVGLEHVQLETEQRPSASATKVKVQIAKFGVLGVQQGERTPELVMSKDLAADGHLLQVVFETNPIGMECSQRVEVVARPLQVVYDAQTVIELVKVFQLPQESSAMAQLQLAASSKLSDLKEMSTLGMQHAVDTHQFVDIKIDIAASYIVVPHSGAYTGNEPCLVIKLGAINVVSEPRSTGTFNVQKLFSEGHADEDILKQVISHTYDKMIVSLSEIQLVMSSSAEDWRAAIRSTEATPMHLLQPTSLKVMVHKCVITDDPRLPHIKVIGELEQVAINAEEDRLMALLELFVSIPFPESEQEVSQLKLSDSRASSLSLLKYLDISEKKRPEADRPDDEMSAQLTKLEAMFVLKEFTLNVSWKHEADAPTEKFLQFGLERLELTAKQQTYTLQAAVKLGAVRLEHFRAGRPSIKVVDTPADKEAGARGDQEYLFNVCYINVDKRCPDFRSHYKSVEQLITLDFTTLKILLHLEGLKQLLFIVSEIQQRVEKVQGQKDRVGSARNTLDTILEEGETFLPKPVKSTAKMTKRRQIETIQLKVNISLGAVLLRFTTDDRRLCDIRVYGLNAGLIMKQSYTQVDCSLDDVRVLDPNPNSIHNEIVKVLGTEVMKVRLVLYDLENYPGVSETDMSLEASINCLRIVFLNWFVSTMLDFVHHFQQAEQAIIDASNVAADAARANVQSAYKNSTKISLKVRLSAPIIIIPQNSSSDLAVVVDLGQLTLSNKFYELATEDQKGTVTVDDLTLSLVNMKVSTVKLTDSDQYFERERMLIKPTSFNLHVKRSLSAWYEALPDLDVSGRLKTIVITIGQSDFSTIMNILKQNLTEGSFIKKEEPPKPQSSARLTTKTSRIDADTKMSKGDSSNVAGKAPRTTIKFSFTMDSLVIDLVSTQKSSDTDLTTSEVGLARFCLALLSLKGRMLSDDAMHTSILLVDCTLDDMRPGRENKIHRYLERRSDTPIICGDDLNITLDTTEKVRSMIDVTYTVKKADTYVDVRIFSFNLILAVDFLMKLSEYASTGLASVPAEDLNELSVAPSKHILAAAKTEIALTKGKSASGVPDQPTSTNMFTVNLRVEQPDIILIESLEEQDCEAMVMNTEVTFKMRSNSERTVMDGAIMELQMFTTTGSMGDGGWCISDEEGPRHYLLEPCSVSLAASQPNASGMHVDLIISSIKINVSPENISLLNRVMKTMTQAEDADTEQEGDKVILYEDLWAMKPFDYTNFWFLKTEVAEDALALTEEMESSSALSLPKGEICMMCCNSIIVSLEISVGTENIPILAMQAALSGQVTDWSTDLNLQATMGMTVMYYNIQKALWEPFIEPIETLKDNRYVHIPWELKLEVVMRQDDQSGSMDMTDEAAVAQAMALVPPKMSVLIVSTEPLEMTMTLTCLEVLKQLSTSFSSALESSSLVALLDKSKQSGLDQAMTAFHGAPYVLHNSTGLTVQVMLAKSEDFAVFSKTSRHTGHDYREVLLKPGAAVALQLKKAALNLLTLDNNLPQFKLYFKLVEIDEDLCIAVERVDKRYFPLKRLHTSDTSVAGSLSAESSMSSLVESRGLITEIIMQEGAIHVYLRSVVQVRNNLLVPVTVYFMTAKGNEVRSLGEVASKDVLRLPLSAAYSPTAEIFFSVEGFTVSVCPFVWRDLQQEMNISKLLNCESKDRGCEEKFYIRAIGSMEQVYLEDTNKRTLASTCYEIVLEPAVKLQNCLPAEVIVSQPGLKRTYVLKPGEMSHMSHLAPYKAKVVMQLENYMDKCWTCTRQLPSEQEIDVWSFESHDSPAVMTLDLGLHHVDQGGSQMLSLYCPFWMLNKTGLNLGYRTADDSSNVIYHRADNPEPVLFSFRAKNFFGKKKAAIRVEFGEWSEKFSLDVAGSSGVVLCRNEGVLYQVAVTNELTFNSLTKMVVFTPFFIIINEAPFPIECQEMGRPADSWLRVEASSSKALWPVTEKEDKLLVTRVADSQLSASPFLYTEQHTTTLKLLNDYGGLNVETQLSEGGTYITIRQYRPGLAPALIINYSAYDVTVYEKESVNSRTISSMHSMLYTWENPCGPRTLVFEGYKRREIFNDLRQDGLGEYQLNANASIYWVSFLDGMQRVVLFTDNDLLAHGIHTAGDVGRLDMDVTVSIQGIGLSLVNDARHEEILYISISNSGIVWEQCKVGSKRYKRMDPNKVLMFEDAYQRYQNECFVAKTDVPGVVVLDNKIEVDFREMRQLRPTPKLLQRTLEPGLWASYGVSSHRVRIHARLHRLQVDEQLRLPTFPVVLAPVPPPRSVAHEGAKGMKPFIELSIFERVMEHTNVRQYKYYKILVQEFHLKIDLGLVNALLGMFPVKTPTEQEALELFLTDLRNAGRSLEDVAAEVVASDQKHFYDMLHLSPIKVHMSFSLGDGTHLPTFVGTVLASIGVTLTDMNDVVFKLGYYEKNYEFLSRRELAAHVTRHYTSQAIRQLYVLVLGLDVIGNPYGLIIGLKKGVEDLFYEPFQGAIQGPGEFAEGLVLGVRSLVGHTVGGAAGAVSRIAGAMGHGLAALSLDEDFQKRRRDNRNKRPANLQEGLARSGKGLVMGVVDGVTGVFTKPISGAREQGVEGFFKGLGKGAVGLVARPTAGVVDFASGSLDAVKRAADVHEEVRRRRPARYLPHDSGVKPYSRVQAEGYKLLFELDKSKYFSTDNYATHVWVVPTKEAVVCTDQRILYIEKNLVFGNWQTVWTYLWTELPEPPVIVERGVFIPMTKKKVLGMFASSGAGKLIPIIDDAQKKYFQAYCERLMKESR